MLYVDNWANEWSWKRKIWLWQSFCNNSLKEVELDLNVIDGKVPLNTMKLLELKSLPYLKFYPMKRILPFDDWKHKGVLDIPSPLMDNLQYYTQNIDKKIWFFVNTIINLGWNHSTSLFCLNPLLISKLIIDVVVAFKLYDSWIKVIPYIKDERKKKKWKKNDILVLPFNFFH